MRQQNQRSKKTLALVGAICGSLLFGLPAFAQTSNQNAPLNGNGELRPNNDRVSPDSNNPGVNQSPEQRLTPSNINQNSSGSSRNGSGNNGSSQLRNSGSIIPGVRNQRPMNGTTTYPSNSNSNSLGSSNRSSALNPCPSIFSEAKYKNTVGVPAGCPASSSGTSSSP
jgi:hypothetical protein